MIPVAGTRIALHVRSFLDPTQPGTEVSARQSLKGYPVKAIAMLPGQAIVMVAGKGMVGVSRGPDRGVAGGGDKC